MKKSALCLTFAIMLLLGCKLDIEPGTPGCVEKKIKKFNRQEACGSAKVTEYWFQNKTVFVFDPGLCGADMTSEVIDADCNTMGYLGGFAGNTKINGEEFSHAVFIKPSQKKN